MMTVISLILSLLVNTNWVTANMAVTTTITDAMSVSDTADTQHTYYICDECGDIYVDITDADGVWLDDEAVFICAKHFATAIYQSCLYSYTYDIDSMIDVFENVGDVVTAVFDDNGTPDNVLDDTVVSVSVNGSTFDVCYCELIDD